MIERFGKSSMLWIGFLSIFWIAPLCTRADSTVKSQSTPAYAYHVPERLDNGWAVASLEEEGVEKEKITDLIRKILEDNYKNIHSVLLVKNGKLILEEYFHGYNRERLHEIRSATKSIGSVLTGIAIDRGFIKNADETIYPYFKSYEPPKQWDVRVRDITLKNLMTMTSGYDCDDHGPKKFNCERDMYQADDWLEYALNLPMAYQPGEHWAYNSASLWLVGEMISKTSGMAIPEFAEKYLFEPIGIKDFKWGYSPKGRAWLAGNARMKPRDMAKFGSMVLNEGQWETIQIVSKKWIAESTKEHFRTHGGAYGYGYLWWRGKSIVKKQIIETIAALGNGGQHIYIFPRLNMVAVFTGGNYNSDLSAQSVDMLIKYILPAVLSPPPAMRAAEINSKILKKYVGQYYLKRMNLTLNILIENENLKLHDRQKDKDEKIDLWPETETVFCGTSSDVGDIQLTFITDDRDKVTHFYAHGGFGFTRLKFEKTGD
jgi:CubicO group peptidase (beta-lactamase class C family)